MESIKPEIKPLNGFGDLLFGKEIKEVTEFLGEPDAIEEVNEEGFTGTTICFYEKIGLTAFFEGLASPKLAIIEVRDTSSTLFGKKVFGMSESEITTLMRSNGFHEEEKEKEEWGEERLSFHDALIDFYFENGELLLVNWGVMIEDGEIKNLNSFAKN
jgi:hypothetical protein